MEEIKINWIKFGEYKNAESTDSDILDESFKKVFDRKFSTNHASDFAKNL